MWAKEMLQNTVSCYFTVLLNLVLIQRKVLIFFNGIQSVLRYCINFQTFILRGTHQGRPGALKLIIWHMLITFKPKGLFQILRCRWLGFTNTYNFVLECSPPGVTLRTIEPFFEILYQYPGIYPQRNLLWASPTLKTNYIAYINDFETNRPILDLKVSLDRASQDINLCLKG